MGLPASMQVHTSARLAPGSCGAWPGQVRGLGSQGGGLLDPISFPEFPLIVMLDKQSQLKQWEQILFSSP